MEIYYKNHHKSKKLCSLLFPENRILCDCLLLHPIESNIPLMCSKNTNLIGSLNPNSTLVTRGIYYNTKMGYVYTIEIFGNTDAYFRDHFILYI